MDHSHTVELGHTHMQVAGGGRPPVEDTVQLRELGNLAATGVVAHTFVAPVGDQMGRLAFHTVFAAETVDLVEGGIRNLGEVTAVVMDVAMGD